MSLPKVWRPLDEHASARRYAEEAIVRAIFTWPQTHVDVFSKLIPDHFAHGELKITFEAALSVFQEGGSVDMISIAARLEEKVGHRPPWFPARLQTPIQDDLVTYLDGFSADYIGHVPHWIELLHRHQRFARFKEGAESARTVEHMVGVATEALENEGLLAQSDEIPWSDSLAQFAESQVKILEGNATAGHSWGVETLDDVCLLRPGCFYVVAGIKKGGKSHLLQHALVENAKAGNPVFFFSLEMGIQQVIRRWLAHETGINSRRIQSKMVTPEEHERLKEASAYLNVLPIKVNQSPRITPAEVLARVRAWKRKEKIEDGHGLVAVDFLQLMPLPHREGQNESSGLKGIAYELARIAKEAQVPLIAAAQLRNEAEGQRPQMRYLEGSGGIAQAAESILLLDLLARRSDGLTTAGLTAMDVFLYQRNGESGRKVELMADLATSQFIRKYPNLR